MEHGRFTIISDPGERERQAIRDGLKAYNDPIAGDDGHREINFAVRDDSGAVVGGLLGGSYWGWLHVEILWIAEAWRHRGLGSLLLARAEAEAVARGCRFGHLDTMSFQALDFYRRLGWVLKCEFTDLPRGHSKYVLMKQLAD